MKFMKIVMCFDAVRKISSLFINKQQSITVGHLDFNSVHPSKLKLILLNL